LKSLLQKCVSKTPCDGVGVLNGFWSVAPFQVVDVSA
jgi:hypothetical protein